MMAYVLVDAISQFRIRYAVEVPDELSDKEKLEWANDSVTCQELEEFSQEHLGEVISSTRIVTKGEVLSTFRLDNDYLSSWGDDLILSKIQSIDSEGTLSKLKT